MLSGPRLTLYALVAAGAVWYTPARGQVPEIYFSPARNLSNNAAPNDNAAITQDAGLAIYLAWADSGGFLFVRSEDDGATFTPPRQLGPPPDFDQGVGGLTLAGAAAGVAHAAFTSYDLVFGGAEIRYVRTTDGGATFSPPTLISTVDRFNSIQPKLAAGWAVAVAWEDSDLSTGEDAIMYSQSVDGGAMFSPPRRLSTPGPGFKGCPSVALAGTGTVYVAWVENVSTDWRTVFSRSLDGGLNFSPPVTISSGSPEWSWCPSLVVDGAGTVLAFWAEGPAFGAQDVLFARSTDGGASFSLPTEISDPGNLGSGLTWAVVTSEGTVLVTWRMGTFQSYSCRMAAVRADGTLSAPVEPPYCGPMSARGPGALHVTWYTLPPVTPWDVFYSRGAIRPSVPRSFFAVPPCRVADTRGAEGPALAANTRRTFSVGGRCGIPPDAVAVAANATTTVQTDVGDLRAYGAGGALPHASTINFVPGRTRANNATVALGTNAAVTVLCDMPPASTGSTHFVLDVSGYYR